MRSTSLSGLGHQAHQSGDEVQRLKDHMDGAVPVQRFQPVTDVAIGVSNRRFSDTAGLLRDPTPMTSNRFSEK